MDYVNIIPKKVSDLKDDRKAILVVDDSEINRELMYEILKNDYIVRQAVDGAQALKILKDSANRVDAVILDIFMPKMDGYQLLDVMKQSKKLSQIPVIVFTEKSDRASEKKALESGAWDFVSKPYDLDIIKLRIKNVIARSQMPFMEQLHRLNNYDTLTGVYTKRKFFAEGKKLIDANPDTQFAFLRVDIDRFKLINSFFGVEGGDNLLKFLAKGVREFSINSEKTVFGRVEADVFGMITPYLGRESTEKMLDEAINKMKSYSGNYNVVLVYGVYIITNTKLPVAQMCDRAALAAKTVKGNYMKSYAFYDERMRFSIENEQNIINEMSEALASGQFVPYYQPKYDVRTNKPAGAEALARWIHPTKGFISPAEFIPVFEKNGFISKLDFYIWESVCEQLKDWKDRGVNLFPVSVNVSRVNLYNPNIVDIIVGLTEKYGIAPQYFNIEITESVYTDDNVMIDKITGDLKAKGFTILMDDFGSGYSSLNVLKDVMVDVLKLDMKFMFKAKYEGRAETIISSVIRMAKWLNIPVIAEGVDKREQVDFLRSLGCDYIQGFYFAKPMPAADYGKLISEQQEFIMPSRNDFSSELIWNKNNSVAASIENIPQPALVVEYSKDRHMEVVSVNQPFNSQFGFAADMYGKYNMLDAVDDECKNLLSDTIQSAVDNRDVSDCVFSMHNMGGRKMWIRAHFKYVSKTDVSSVLIVLIHDVTSTKITDERINEYKDYLKREFSKRANVLVVSASQDNCQQLEKILGEKYDVIFAQSISSGLERLEEKHIDLIFFDIDLYEDGGKNFPFGAADNIPLIVITPSHEKLEAHPKLKRRAGDFVMNPFVDAMVLSRAENLITIKTTNMANVRFLGKV